MTSQGLQKDTKGELSKKDNSQHSDIVLEKSIFSNVFEKDIRRVYIYKKAERIGKALHLVAPAFKDNRAIRDRLQSIAVSLVDASTLPMQDARVILSRELLSLLSMLSIARSSRILTAMNADIVSREVENLLQEVASYDEPNVVMEAAPTIASLTKTSTHPRTTLPKPVLPLASRPQEVPPGIPLVSKGHANVSNTVETGSRKESVLNVLKTKGPSSIKDISTIIRGVSEKTIQRELQNLVNSGLVSKTGERRWTTYTLASS